jgi:phosphoserine aminotransferase
MGKVYNFCAGPAVLPEEVLREAQTEFLDYHGTGMSIMESSHREKEYDALHEEALSNFRTLLRLPDDYSVLLLQGGASLQFAMVPMNLLGEGQTADYVHSGEWSGKAIREARILGKVALAGDTARDIPTRMPDVDKLTQTPGAAYLHLTSNETISGAQYKTFPRSEAPLVADMSSDFLSREFDVTPFGLIYAGAQKNLGPAGCAVVILRRDLAERVPHPRVPNYFRYATHLEAHSMYNTPPTFTIYLIALVTRWLIRGGGVAAMEAKNRAKASRLYAALDESGFYRPTAVQAYRSDMNVTFRLPTEELESRFCKEASATGLKQLKGHRSVGGIRASIYNAFPPEGVDALIAFMKEFEKQNG